MTVSPVYDTTVVGVVGNPATQGQNDAAKLNVMLGRHNEMLMRELGGRYSAMALRASGGNAYLASNVVAGVTIPVGATTIASTAGMINPVGSGVNVELVALSISSTTVQVAVKNMAIGFHRYALLGEGAPTSVTALTDFQLPIGKSGTASCHAHSAATFTNTAALNPIIRPWPVALTAVGAMQTMVYFNGEITFGPGVAFAIHNEVTALAGQQVTYHWIEWPQ